MRGAAGTPPSADASVASEDQTHQRGDEGKVHHCLVQKALDVGHLLGLRGEYVVRSALSVP